jgi:glycosyltransferase involved in cell wall biosynthesis
MTIYDTIIVVVNPFFLANKDFQNRLKPYLSKGEKVYLQVVWETDPLPKSWNFIWDSDLFTGFIAPSHFMENLLKVKTKKPVFYIPHYVNTSLFRHVDVESKSNEKLFTVLCAGQWTKRKGHEDAIVSFTRALSLFPDCRLVVKYSRMPGDNSDVENEIRKMVMLNSAVINSPVFVCGDAVSNEALVDLYHRSSLLLYPSRGEGFGFITTEMMSIGVPIIYTDWSATPETAKAPGNIPVKYVLDECVGMANFGYERGLKYAMPLISELIMALELKYTMWKENKKLYYEEVADNYKIINEKYGVESVKNKFIEFFEKN